MKKLNWQTQPSLEPTIIRIDPVEGKFHIDAKVYIKPWRNIVGIIILMWCPEWAYVQWNPNKNPRWIKTELLDVL